MGGRHRSRAGLRLNEDGSAVVEGIAGLAIAFLLLTLVVQLAFLVVARNAAQSATDQAARAGARIEADLGAIERNLAEALEATVPGAGSVTSSLFHEGRDVRATAEVSWNPPGPRWAAITIRVESVASPSVSP